MRLLALSGVTAAAAACTQCPLPQLNVTAFMPCLKQPIGEECCVVGRPMVSNPCVKVWLANPMLAPYKAVVEKARIACAVEKMADCEASVATACPTECGASAPAPNTMMPPSDMMPPSGMMPGMPTDMKMPPGMPPPGMNPGMKPPQAGMSMNMQMNLQMMGPMGTSPMRPPQGMGCPVCPFPTSFDASAFAPCMAKDIGEACCMAAKPMMENPCAKVWMNGPMLGPYMSTIKRAAEACKVTKMPECSSAVAMVCPHECGVEGKMTPCQARVANQTRDCAGKIGCAISQCMPDGSFVPRQCHGSTGFCWCVDKDGKELDGSRKRGGVSCGDFEKEKTPCQKRAQAEAAECGKKIGCDQIKCNEDGSFMTKQCRGSTGYCWCVDKDGKEVEGSKKGPGAGEVNCAADAATTPSKECNCPPVECAPGFVKKLKLGTEGCCKENYRCVPDAPKIEKANATIAANASDVEQKRGQDTITKPRNRGGKRVNKPKNKPAPTAAP